MRAKYQLMSIEAENTPARIQVCVGIVVHNGRVLIGCRPAGVRLAGYWEFPGGKLEPGEAPHECVVREMLEETGLAVRIMRPLTTIDHADADMTVEMRAFLCEPAQGSEKSPELRGAADHELRWVAKDELSNYRFPPANASLLRELEALLGAS